MPWPKPVECLVSDMIRLSCATRLRVQTQAVPIDCVPDDMVTKWAPVVWYGSNTRILKTTQAQVDAEL